MDLDATSFPPPSNWVSTTLGELLTVLRGVTYNKQASSMAQADGLVPILRATNISESLDFDNLVYVPTKFVSKDQYLQAGDIVVAASSGSASVVGKAAPLLRDWHGSFGAFCYGLRPSNGVSPKFLAFFLQTSEYRNQVSALAAGVNINNLRRNHIEDMRLNLAPLAEQQRIVAEIERQFSLLDAGVANLKRVQANLKRYRAAVLQAACEGRLVPTEAELARAEGRDYEPASVLLTRILAERRERWEAEQLAKMEAQGKLPMNGAWKGKYQEPAQADTRELPNLSAGWRWTSLDQLLSLLRNGSGVVPNADAGIAMLRISAVRPLKVHMDQVRFVPPHKIADCADYELAEGDLLFTRYNGNPDFVGVCGVVRSLPRPTVHPDKLIRGEVIEKLVSPFFLEVVLNSGFSRDFVRSRVRTTAGQAGVSGGDLKVTPVPLPPLPEQERIVAEVERHLSVIDQLEKVVTANLKRAERLRQSILKEAFAGRLVPQDPADEPASALLDRIRAEREAKQDRKETSRRQKASGECWQTALVLLP